MARQKPKLYENPVGSCDVGEYRDALPSVVPNTLKGRGSQLNPGNRHETRRLFVLGEHWDPPSPPYPPLPTSHPSPQSPPYPPTKIGCAASPHSPPYPSSLANPSSPSLCPSSGSPADFDSPDPCDSSDRFLSDCDDDRPPVDLTDQPSIGSHGGLTEVLPDDSRSILNHVDSPDIPYSWTINPYRGCEHGCIYCYARPDHERLGFSCGLDFETRIMAKFDAPKLLERELANPKWTAEPVTLCGVTDCYQPIEAKYRITRACLQVMARCRQPVVIITKNKLVTRDIDLLAELNRFHAVHVCISVTTLDNHLASIMEPRASSPKDRLAAISMLSQAGIPVTVMTAPIIPAINDHEMPSILQAAANAGATSAGYVLLRLPYQLKELYEDWLFRYFPDRAERALNLLRESRGGQLYDAAFGQRMTGTGPLAKQLKQMFRVFVRRYGLAHRRTLLSGRAFTPPVLEINGQMNLFQPAGPAKESPASLF